MVTTTDLPIVTADKVRRAFLEALAEAPDPTDSARTVAPLTIEECVYWIATTRLYASWDTALLTDAIVMRDVDECRSIERRLLADAQRHRVAPRAEFDHIWEERRRKASTLAWLLRQARFAMLREVGQ